MWLLAAFFLAAQLYFTSSSLPFPLPLAGVFKCHRETAQRFANSITVHCENVTMIAGSVTWTQRMVVSINAPKYSLCEYLLRAVARKCFQGYLFQKPIHFITASNYHVENNIEGCEGKLALWSCGVNSVYGTFIFNVVCRDTVLMPSQIYSDKNGPMLEQFVVLLAICSFVLMFSYIVTLYLRDVAEQLIAMTD
ncbi:hypothetical protein Tcan_12640 [Toxocara canis]|uniref:Uncharacterized protein n=1 Tax=Toxocara canis TaxID=6265 RepID=A0A0B2VL85_TOXCA|nr:hypothetical protein Tcan_12640 [Toxocara canis]